MVLKDQPEFFSPQQPPSQSYRDPDILVFRHGILPSLTPTSTEISTCKLIHCQTKLSSTLLTFET